MNEKLKGYALAYAKKGFSTIPVDAHKQPAIFSWNKYQTQPMSPEEIEEAYNKKNVFGIALLTGGTNRITAIDFDLKYDLTDELFNKYKIKIPVELLKRMLVHSTKNDGFHFIFQCDTIEPNQKLAQRETSDREVYETFRAKVKEHGVKRAMKSALNDKVRILIETRGGTDIKSGGYVIIPPTEGYKKLAGKLNHISTEEYDILMIASREFNTYNAKNNSLSKQYVGSTKKGNSPFDYFNSDGDVLSLLYSNGWSEVRGSGSDIRLKRPGQTHSKSSALYDTNTRLLNVFTTSTEFEVGTHTPSDVFIILQCNNDVKKAYKELISLGFKDDRKNN